MRILVISNLYPAHHIGGYELRCQTVVRALRQRGHTVQVLTSDHQVAMRSSQAAALVEDEAVSRELRVHGFFGHPWLSIFKLRGLEFHNNRVVREAVAKMRPDVVHVWNMGGISKSILHTLEELGVPVAYDISDHWIARSLEADVWLNWWNRTNTNRVQRLLRWGWGALGLHRRWSRLAPTGAVSSIAFRRIYFCSDAMRRITMAKGYAVEHGEVIHCPVDGAAFNAPPVPADRPLRRLLYVGRLAEDKGTLTALRAMALIHGHFHGTLHVYGSGDAQYVARCTSYVRDHALPVTFHHATAEEMPGVYAAHDALLFTSEWEEPFALTPLEAMASGIPVIGTTTGGSAELLQDGVNSLTYQAGHSQGLAEAIMKLAANGELRHRLATAGQRYVRQICALPAIVSQIEAFLETTHREWPQLTMSRPLGATKRSSLTHGGLQLASS